MKLFVGTYAAYNRGSLRGAWVDLDKYDSKEEFIKACRRLHRSERDPEFMFQDVEYTWGEDWERNYYDESYIDEEYWTEMKSARARKLAESAKPKKSNPVREEYIAALVAEGLNEEEARERSKDVDVVIKLVSGKFIEIKKALLKTSHCEGEDEGMGGPTIKEAQERCDYFKTREGFRAHNLAQIRDFEDIDRSEYGLLPVFCGLRMFKRDTAKVYCIGRRSCCYMPDATVEMTSDDWARFDKGVEIAREHFAKRIDAYWKRYGASKLRTWTYWMSA